MQNPRMWKECEVVWHVLGTWVSVLPLLFPHVECMCHKSDCFSRSPNAWFRPPSPNRKKCSVRGCNSIARDRESRLCRHHINGPNKCSFNMCGRPAVRDGRCKTHYAGAVDASPALNRIQLGMSDPNLLLGTTGAVAQAAQNQALNQVLIGGGGLLSRPKHKRSRLKSAFESSPIAKVSSCRNVELKQTWCRRCSACTGGCICSTSGPNPVHQ